MVKAIMSRKTLLVEEIPESEEDSQTPLYNSNNMHLFYCSVFNKKVATPPGNLELKLQEIPKYSCYDCYDSCRFQKNNIKYLDEAIVKILTNRKSLDEDFLKNLDIWYKKRLIKGLNILIYIKKSESSSYKM
jgi:ribosomal protein RSM22 (predicted rRNA methylase)